MLGGGVGIADDALGVQEEERIVQGIQEFPVLLLFRFQRALVVFLEEESLLCNQTAQSIKPYGHDGDNNRQD